MPNFKLDDNNDIIIGRGTVKTSGPDYVVQLVKNRLQTQLGEWALDRNIGVPWYDGGIIEKNTNLDLVRGILSDAIVETPGVAVLHRLEMVLDRNERKLTVIFQATTVFDTEITEEVSL